MKVFSKTPSKFIYQAKEVWFLGLYQKIIEIYQKKKKKKKKKKKSGKSMYEYEKRHVEVDEPNK